MRKITLSLLLAMTASLLHVVAAQAQLPRTFVSAQGLDTNPCSLAQPCRSMQHAHDMTNAGGEINVLNTAGYGSMIINKAISIVSEGVNAGMLATSGGIGITINAGPNDVINLRGLDIEGSNSGTYGIRFNTGQSLNIQKSTVRDFTNTGILFGPSGSGTSSFFVSDVLVVNCGNYGILVQPGGSGAVKGVLNRALVNQNGIATNGAGIYVYGGNSTGTLNVTVADSVVAGNPNGIAVASMSTLPVPSGVMVRNSTVSNNTFGIFAQSATVFVGQSTVSGNTTGWLAASGGPLDSYGNNNVNGNVTNGSPTSTISLQ